MMRGDRIACLPIAPAENAAAKILGGLALTAVGVFTIKLGGKEVDITGLADLDEAVAQTGGFFLGESWMYRTRVPGIGTMLMDGTQTITTRQPVPREILAKLTPNRTPPSPKVVFIVCGVGGAILAAATITFAATGSFELLFGIGFWGLLFIGTALFAWLRVHKHTEPGG